jgi:hypothetical protein
VVFRASCENRTYKCLPKQRLKVENDVYYKRVSININTLYSGLHKSNTSVDLSIMNNAKFEMSRIC